MSAIYARPVRPDGTLGDPIASAVLEGAGVQYYGESWPIRDKITSMMVLRGMTEREAYDHLQAEGTSSGKLSIGA